MIIDVSYKELLGFLSSGMGILSLGLYIKTIFYGTTKPHYFTWLIWSLLMGIAFAAQMSENAGPGSWVIGLSAVGCFMIAVLGFFRGEKNITRSDKIAFACGLAAIPLWQITKNPQWSVILVTLIDCIGFYPTFRKTWYKPYEEPVSPYVISLFTMLVSVFALQTINLTTALYPSALVFANAAFVVMIYARRSAGVKQHG